MKWSTAVTALFVLLLVASPVVGKDKTTAEDRLDQLEERIDQLEKEQSLRRKNVPSPSAAPSPTTATGISRAFNPAISVNGLLLGTYVSERNTDTSSETKTELEIQEVEIRMTGNIDSYLRGDLTLSMEETDSIEIEELIVDFLATQSLSFRAGKFFAPFGKHNLRHTHQFAFVDRPVVNEEIFGNEGLNETGFSLNYLLPTDFFSEVNLLMMNGDNTSLFNAPLNNDFAYMAHSKNLFDLTDDLTLELGGSYAYGKNNIGSGPYKVTEVAGADVTFKYKPIWRERYTTLIWQSEFITSSKDEVKTGVYTQVQYQFAQRWWLQGRYGYFFEERTRENKNRYTGLLAFVPSEFSALRLQYNYLNQLAADEHQAFLQLNFTFGSHPAHEY